MRRAGEKHVLSRLPWEAPAHCPIHGPLHARSSPNHEQQLRLTPLLPDPAESELLSLQETGSTTTPSRPKATLVVLALIFKAFSREGYRKNY